MIATDKLLHGMAGFIIGAVLIHVSLFVATLGIVLAAAGKELYDDVFRDSDFDWRDFVATLIGGAMGVIIMSVAHGLR